MIRTGRLNKVNLRMLWKNEARDFTPWLAQQENIQLLGEALGFDLEVVSQEENVGSFKADILCRDSFRDTYIVIENQLERTDHSHLGQVITYAAGLDANTIIWISSQFTEEHRAALDLLNRITDDSFQIFGIEIQLYKIGDSDPAPQFNIVSKPNNWSKQAKKTTQSGELSGTKLFQMEYWQGLKDFMETRKSPVRMRNPKPQNWSDISIGKSDVWVSAAVYSKTNTIEVWLVMRGKQAKENFDKLYTIGYDESITQIDPKINWDRMDDKTQCAVILRKDAIYTDKSDWNSQFQWFKDNLEKYIKFFKPLMARI